MITENAERCRADYYYYKTRGICVSCHSEHAMLNAVRCHDCAEKLAERDKARYERLKADPEYRPKVSNYRRELRQHRREAGICHECGKRPAADGYVRCNDCLIARRRKKDSRYNNDILRSERTAHDLCYICGNEAMHERGLCEKHYEEYSARFKAMADYYRENPTQVMKEAKTRIQRLNSQIFRNRKVCLLPQNKTMRRTVEDIVI